MLLQPFVRQGIEALLIEVQRKIGAQLPIGEVLPYLRGKVCQSHIRMADREFTVFAEVAINGVARSWQLPQ